MATLLFTLFSFAKRINLEKFSTESCISEGLCSNSLSFLDNSDRIGLAKKFARDNGVILVLKSEETIVTDGNSIYINKIGNPGMATAGSGDVLSGVISALLHRLDNYEAACLGVYIHSLAGDLASKDLCEDSIIASDIVKYIPGAMKLLR